MEEIWTVHSYIFILVIINGLMDKTTSLGCGSHMEYLVSGQRGIPDSGFSASSTYPNGGNLHDPKYARLYYYKVIGSSVAAAWSSHPNNIYQHIQVSFSSPMVVCSIITQGRSNYNQWVTSYTVTYSSDNRNWMHVTNSDNQQIFQGNADKTTVVSNNFHQCVETSNIRINPQTWSGHISMRIDFQGCSKTRSDFLSLKETAKIRVWQRSKNTQHSLKQISQDRTTHFGSCAVKCHQNPVCVDYIFYPSDNTCTLLSKNESANIESIPDNSRFYSPNIDYLAKSYDYETKLKSDTGKLHYRITAEKKTKSEATKACHTDDGRLLVINSTEIIVFIQQEIQTSLILAQETEYFVNGEYNGSKWVFETEEEIPAFLWATSYPQTNNGDCVVITQNGLQTKNCSSALYFICELSV